MSERRPKKRRGNYYPARSDRITIRVEQFHDCDERGREVGEGMKILRASVPIVARHHRESSGGQSLSVGEVSEGSLDLALNILGYLYPPACDGAEPKRCRVNLVSATVFELHERFCREFLAPMDADGGEISVAKIRSWVEHQPRFADQ